MNGLSQENDIKKTTLASFAESLAWLKLTHETTDADEGEGEGQSVYTSPNKGENTTTTHTHITQTHDIMIRIYLL